MKSTQNEIEKGQELYRKLVQEAWEDSNFKERLISAPLETLEQFTGSKMTKTKNIVIEDQSDSNIIFLNIPRKINIEEIELSEEQLELVAGGGALNDFIFRAGIINGIIMRDMVDDILGIF